MSRWWLWVGLWGAGCGGGKSDSDHAWVDGTACPTAAFRDACDDLDSVDSLDEFDRFIFADTCAAADRGFACPADEACLDDLCVPVLEDASAACTASPTELDADFVDRFVAVAMEWCSGESWGEGISSTAYLQRRGDGTLEAFYGTRYDGGLTAPCFPEELVGIELRDTECVPQPRVGWEEVRHNLAVYHPELPGLLYTGQSAELTLGTEVYTMTVGRVDRVLTRGPTAEGDGAPPDRLELLVVRDGYTPPGPPPE